MKARDKIKKLEELNRAFEVVELHDIKPDTVYLLEPGEYIGSFPIRQDITVLPADQPKKLRLDWKLYEGFEVYKVTFSGTLESNES
jgi:hypothetical protein